MTHRKNRPDDIVYRFALQRPPSVSEHHGQTSLPQNPAASSNRWFTRHAWDATLQPLDRTTHVTSLDTLPAFPAILFLLRLRCCRLRLSRSGLLDFGDLGRLFGALLGRLLGLE